MHQPCTSARARDTGDFVISSPVHEPAMLAGALAMHQCKSVRNMVFFELLFHPLNIHSFSELSLFLILSYLLHPHTPLSFISYHSISKKNSKTHAIDPMMELSTTYKLQQAACFKTV